MGPLVRRRVARGACAAIASALIAAGLARADAMDDWAKAIDGVVAELSRPGAQDEFDKIFGDRLKKAGRLLFVDHEYSVTKGSFGSSGWTIPELPYVMGDTPPVGPQLYARWATKGKTGREHESLAVAVKFTHVDKFGDALKTTIGGTAHPNSDAGALVAAWHKEWVVRLKEYREPAKEGEAAPPPAEDNSAEPPSKEEEAAARDR